MIEQIKKYKSKIPYALLVLLFISNYYLLVQYYDLKWEIVSISATPNIELNSDLFFETKTNTVSGSLSGFVKFNNIEQQPKAIRQYYTIVATDKYDDNHQQIFYYDEIIKLDNIPPKITGREILTKKIENDLFIMLVDRQGNSFAIYKTPWFGKIKAGDVLFKDVTGDSGNLILNQSEFRDYIYELKNNNI